MKRHKGGSNVSGLGMEISTETPEQKVKRRKALKKIQSDYQDKKWRLENTNGPHSCPEQSYPKVFYAKPNKEEE